VTAGSYEAAVGQASTGGVVAAVEPHGPAGRAGIRVGDVVRSVDGIPVRDVIDWQWATTEERFEVGLADVLADRPVIVARAWNEPLGLEFASPVFDRVRECDNACAFCFVSQLPDGLRPSLYVRDDDFRLSFLAGTFITLTNVSDDDVARILEQRLSPLYVSLHTVDPEIRRSLVCVTSEDVALERFDQLVAGGIEIHVQIVLVPGVNDGEVLERTLAWLALRAQVASVGVVPLGFTAHQRRFASSYGDAAAAAGVLDALEPWRVRMAEERGERWVHAADELYLAAGRDVPSAEDYDGFPQYENGIGLVRAFADEWAEATADEPRLNAECTLVTGELFAPALERLLAPVRESASACAVLAVPNRFFGGNVSVTGLLAGVDIGDAVRAASTAGPFLVPDVVFNEDGLTLDGVSAGELSALTGKDVRVVPYDAAGLADALSALSGTGTK
jgi:putative radical SAM enzyme (TIGR03279 family)